MGNKYVSLIGGKIITMTLAPHHSLEIIKEVGAQVEAYKKEIAPERAVLFIDASQMQSSEHPFVILMKGDENVRASLRNIDGVVVVGLGPTLKPILSAIGMIMQVLHTGAMVISAPTANEAWEKLASMRPDLASILPH